MKTSKSLVLLIALFAEVLTTQAIAQPSLTLTTLRGLRIGEVCLAQREALNALNAEGAQPSDGVCLGVGSLFGHTKIENSLRTEYIETSLTDDFRIYEVISNIKWRGDVAPTFDGLKQSLTERFGRPSISEELPEITTLTWATEDAGAGQPVDISAPLKGCQWQSVNGMGACSLSAVSASIALKRRREAQLNGIITTAIIKTEGVFRVPTSSMIRMYSLDLSKAAKDEQKKKNSEENLDRAKRILPKL